jgi:N-methylhydantoinase B
MRIDPVTLEILNTQVAAATQEMAVTLKRTGRSLYVKESVDFAVGLVTPGGRFFASPRAYGSALIDYDCRPTLDAAGPLDPGDVVITNHPYHSGGLVSHTPDLTLIRPYFHDGRLVCHGYDFVHSTDVGGRVPSSISPTNSEVFQEGLLIPPMKFLRRGVVNEDFLALYRANVRTPDLNLQDLKAMLAALETGARRTAELIAQHGVETFCQAQADLLEYAALKARAVLRRIPDGEYDFWDFLDDDAVTPVPVRFRARVRVDDGRIHIDYTGTDPQVLSAYNVPTLGARHPWLTCRIMHYVTTHDPSVPLNAGIFDSVTVEVPRGTVLNPEFPAATGVRAASAYRCNDAVTGALALAVPEDVPAPSGGAMVPVVLAEHERRTGRRNVLVLNAVIVGSGARSGSDGYDGVDGSISTIRNTPAEKSELEAGVDIIEYGLRADSGGAGRWRGGLGLRFGFRVTQAGSAVLGRGLERFRFRPWGMAGGLPGRQMRVIRNLGTRCEQDLGKIDVVRLDEGETITFLTPGGGGYGDPCLRDEEAVLRDVRAGFVSVESALLDYGVVVRDGRLDRTATAEVRGGRRPRGASGMTFDFGPERAAWDRVFDDSLMEELNALLLRLPVAVRQELRQRLFHRVVPNLGDPARVAAGELITDPPAQRAELIAAIGELRARVPAPPAPVSV